MKAAMKKQRPERIAGPLHIPAIPATRIRQLHNGPMPSYSEGQSRPIV